MRNIKLININKKIYTIIFSGLFLFSLFIHNHPISFDTTNQFESDYSGQHFKYNHNSEFCSACRADGKINKTNQAVRLNLHSSILHISNFEESFNDSHFKLLKETRAPPYFS